MLKQFITLCEIHYFSWARDAITLQQSSINVLKLPYRETIFCGVNLSGSGAKTQAKDCLFQRAARIQLFKQICFCHQVFCWDLSQISSCRKCTWANTLSLCEIRSWIIKVGEQSVEDSFEVEKSSIYTKLSTTRMKLLYQKIQLFKLI